MATFYVAKSGSDHAAGSKRAPFETIGEAIERGLKPGDEIIVRNGTYKENLWIGCDDITLRAANEGGAKIDASGDGRKGGIMIGGDGVTVDGFEVYGSQRSGISATGVEDITITDNFAHHNKRGGIYVGQSGATLIEGNETSYNAADGSFSGISVHRPVGDGDIIVRDNVSHHNLTTIKDKPHTDANGIILDDFRNTKAKGDPFRGEALVEGNVTYKNGGAGIIAVWSDNVTVRDNLAWHNNQDTTRDTFRFKGEFVNRHSSDNEWIGNVAVTNGLRGNKAIANNSDPVYVNRNVVWEDNYTFGPKAGAAYVIASEGDLNPRPRDNCFGVDPGIHMDDDGALATHPWSPLIGTGIGEDWL